MWAVFAGKPWASMICRYLRHLSMQYLHTYKQTHYHVWSGAGARQQQCQVTHLFVSQNLESLGPLESMSQKK